MSKKKKLNKQIRLRHESKPLNPDFCHCDEPEFNDTPIGETEPIFYSKYDYLRENPFSIPIYKCNKCGKNYVLIIAQA